MATTLIAAAASAPENPRRAQILLRSGVLLDLLDPDYSQVHLSDIAHGLAGEIRYNAQSPQRESVAQHSRLMSEWARTCKGLVGPPDDVAGPTLIGVLKGGPQWHPAIAPLIAEYGVPRWDAVALGCLFHDAPEAVMGDIVSPLKRLPEMRWFCDLEELHMARIIEQFKLPDPRSPVWKFVAAIDRAIVTDEMWSLWPRGVGDSAKATGPSLLVAVEPCAMDTAALAWIYELETVTASLGRGGRRGW